MLKGLDLPRESAARRLPNDRESRCSLLSPLVATEILLELVGQQRSCNTRKAYLDRRVQRLALSMRLYRCLSGDEGSWPC